MRFDDGLLADISNSYCNLTTGSKIDDDCSSMDFQFGFLALSFARNLYQILFKQAYRTETSMAIYSRSLSIERMVKRKGLPFSFQTIDWPVLFSRRLKNFKFHSIKRWFCFCSINIKNWVIKIFKNKRKFVRESFAKILRRLFVRFQRKQNCNVHYNH